MNKNKIVLMAAGGVLGVAALVVAVLAYLAWSGKVAAYEGDDETDGLDTVVSKAESLSRKSVYPSAESVKAIDANAAALAAWCDEAEKLAARGDRICEKTTPAAFKTQLVTDAKRLMHLPGAVAGALVKPDFAFGPFKDYILGAKMPADADLASLQRRWDDIILIVEAIAKSNCCELRDIQFKAAAEAPKEEAPRKNAKKPAKKAGSGNKAKGEAEHRPPAAESYVFVFTARPPALVNLVNALATGERFIVVDDLAFVREKDAIATVLGGDEKKAEGAARAGGRRRGRRGQAAAEKEAEKESAAAKNGIVTDPQMDDPFVVTMTVTVYDFRSLEGGDKSEEVKE